ncbi:hypothetical protein M23134_05262 [Microscilla marina ATCC 23134]|uniref:Uncharacterized protein n=1 Tax=Microscilla marina ATCC 23134 TaxID=313606 RepID=A1ZDL7_MICM2|nr:hypothetical protein M23134_05262 [Microscilla marina ATCC 23134]
MKDHLTLFLLGIVSLFRSAASLSFRYFFYKFIPNPSHFSKKTYLSPLLQKHCLQ